MQIFGNFGDFLVNLKNFRSCFLKMSKNLSIFFATFPLKSLCLSLFRIFTINRSTIHCCHKYFHNFVAQKADSEANSSQLPFASSSSGRGCAFRTSA
jgi:hypothetical protein